MNIIELAKKYNFKIDRESLHVPAEITTEDLIFLIDAGYHIVFTFSPWAYPVAQTMIKTKLWDEK